LGVIAIINGAYIKINGNPNGIYVLCGGAFLKFFSSIGLILNNYKRFTTKTSN
jgi:hypothetical protein